MSFVVPDPATVSHGTVGRRTLEAHLSKPISWKPRKNVMAQMILSAALMHGLGHQPGAWRVRGGPSTDYVSADMYAAIARKAEEGKLHVLFLAEQITNQ